MKVVKNISDSVRQKLLNKARAEKRAFNEYFREKSLRGEKNDPKK